MKPNVDLDELRDAIGVDEETDEIPQEAVKFVVDEKQCRLRVPKDFMKHLGIDQNKDRFVFSLKYNQETGKYDLEGKLKRG